MKKPIARSALRSLPLALCSSLFALCSLASPALADGDPVAPATVCVTNARAESLAPITVESFFQGTTLTFTNCVPLAGARGTTVRQGLTGVTVELRLGSNATNIAPTVTTGTVNVVATNWSAVVTVPARSDVVVQVKITDTNGVSYIYPWKTLATKDPL